MKAGFVGRLVLALALTCVMAVALYWGFLRNDKPVVNGSKVELDVSRLENGPAPTTFDTGQPATISHTPASGSNMYVKDGILTFDPAGDGASGAYYASPNLDGSINELGAQWVFSPRTDALGGSISLLVSQGTEPQTTNVIPPIPAQFVVTPINWNLSLRKDNSVQLEPIAAGNFEEPLKVDGTTSYEAKILIDGSNVEITLPDGEKRNVNDARVAQWKGNCATFGLYSNDARIDAVGGFRKIWAASGAST